MSEDYKSETLEFAAMSIIKHCLATNAIERRGMLQHPVFDVLPRVVNRVCRTPQIFKPVLNACCTSTVKE